MKNIVLRNSFFFLILSGINVFAQVKDIGESFEKKAFIQNIDPDEELILVNFVSNNEIVRDVLRCKNALINGSGKEVLSFRNLKYNMEILVEGEEFKEEGHCQAKKITIIDTDKKIRYIKDGRIDFIANNLAFVDGHKVKMSTGKKIIGKKKTGYENKSFESFKELKIGIIAHINGKPTKDGFYLAEEFQIEPEIKTDYNKIADTIDQEEHEKYYPEWIDKSKRTKFFNTEIPGVGKIHPDAEVQDYVHKLGLKLVPEHIKDKIKFLFIVIDNPAVNANVRANGLSYVYSGLLMNMENEAQLASVMGHEIAHAIYMHTADEIKYQQRKEKNKSFVEEVSKATKKTLDKTTNIFKTTDKSKAISEKEVVAATHQELTSLTKNFFDRRKSHYSIEQEFQADRIGLCIMAMAGYDPREAPIVWKNIFDSYGKYKEEAGVNLEQKLVKQVTSDKKETKKNPKAKTSDISKGTEIINVLLSWKSEDFKSKSYRTHPDEVKRFEELNRYVSMYWSNAELLNNSVTNEAEYQQIINRLKTKPTTKKSKK